MAVVYLDVYLLYNLIINSFLLYMAGYILKKRINLFRVLSGGFLGALYGILFVICDINPYLMGVLKLLCSGVMIFIAYRTAIKEYIKLFIVFYISAFCLSGIFIAFSQGVEVKSINDVIYYSYPYHLVILCLMVLFVVFDCFIKQTQKRIEERKLYKNVEIFKGNKRIILTGFLDTGNSVVEPVTGLNTAFVNIESLTNLLDEECINALKNVSLCDNIKLYPVYVTTLTSSGIAMGFIPDKILVDKKEVKLLIAGVSQNFKKKYDILLCFGGSECV